MVNTEPISLPLLVHTVHFGSVQVQPEDVIDMVAPLPPFMKLRRFTLLDNPDESPFRWLQSLEEPALALVVAPFATVVGSGAPELTLPLRQELGLGEDEEPDVYVIISLGARAAEATMNVLAPLYVCRSTGNARQVIISENLSLTRAALL